MRKVLNAGILKRDLSFPIYFQGHSIPASPGDTLASAILASNREKILTSYPFNYSDHLTSMWTTRGHFSHIEETKLSYSRCWLKQEVYPGFIVGEGGKMYDDKRGGLKSDHFNSDLFHKGKNEAIKFPKKELLKFFPWLSTSKLTDFCSKETEESMIFVDVEHVSVELLVVGSGLAGLVAGLTCSRAGIRLMLLESDFILGGRLNSEGENYNLWLRNTILELKGQKNVRICNRTQLVRRHTDGTFLAVEKLYKQDNGKNLYPVYKILKIKAEHTFVATGAIERIPFLLNRNVPGIMPAGLFNTFLNRFGLGANDGVTLYTNNDAGWNTVKYLTRLGLKIDAVIDTRLNSTKVADCPVFRGARVIKVLGKSHLRAVIIRDIKGHRIKIRTSLLAIAAGYSADFDIISKNIQKLEWCPRMSSFKAHLHSSDLTLIGGANSVFCPKMSIEIAYKSACRLIKNRGLRAVSCDLPDFDEENYECQIVGQEKKRFNQNWIKGLLDKNVTDLVQPFNKIKSHYENKEDPLVKMKSEALKVFSNNCEDLSMTNINDQAGNSLNSTRFQNAICEIPNSPFPIFKEDKRISEPFRTLPCHFEYEKLGANWEKDGEWLIPEYFSGHKFFKKKRDLINLEIETAYKSVGMSDMSDLVKIEITGEDATHFIHESFNLEGGKLIVGECQEGFLIMGDGGIIDKMILLRLRTDKYILTTGNCTEGMLYSYLSDASLSKFSNLGIDINLMTELYQVYYLWGPSAGKVLGTVLGLNSGDLKLSPMSVSAIDFEDCSCIVYCCKDSGIPSFRVFVMPSNSNKFFSKIAREILSHKGLLIGRCSAEIMELENGQISTRKLQRFNETGELQKSIRAINDKNDKHLFGQFLKFECFSRKKSYSKIAIVNPVGPTKNIVEGSEVYSIRREGRDQILGHVLVSYFSKMQGAFIGYVYLKRAEDIKKKPVIVLNRGKDYQTECELSSYHLYSVGG